MSNKYQNEKSRNENTNIDDDHQQTAEPSCLYEIKNISKDMINLLHSIHEEIRKKFASSQLLGKIEEIFDKNLELILNYFIRCFQHTDTVKISITNNVVNGLTNIQNSARILTEQYLNQEKINDFQKSSNFFMEEEFVKLINSLSTSIKEFMKNSTSVLKIINSNADSLSDQLLGSKNTINDLLNQINNSLLLQNNNQVKYSQKQGGTQPTTKDKIFKDKLSSLSDKIDILTSLKANLAKNLKFVDNYCSKFYDDSKGIFKQLKTLHTEKLSGLMSQNQEFNQNAENLIAHTNNNNNMINNNNIKDSNIKNRIEEQNENHDLNYNDGNNNVNYDDDDNLFKFSNNNFEGRENKFYDSNSNTANNKFLNSNNLDQQGNYNNANIGVNDNNNYIERENNFKNNSNIKHLTGSNLNNKLNGNSKNKSLNSHMNKSLNTSQMGNNFNLSNNLTNNLNDKNITPINKRHGSTNFNYNTNINDIHTNFTREPRTNSNPKLTGKPFSKNSLLNNSVGKMNASNLNKNPSTPSNSTYYNNYMPHTTKQSNLNKSVGSFNRNKKKINNLSLGNYNNINGNNNLSETEILMVQRNEELNNKINELLVEIKSLQVSYNKLTEENAALKNFNNSSTHGNLNLNQNTSAGKVNAKSVKRTKNNENAFDNSKNSTYIENANLFAMNNNNLCSKCQGMLLNPNSQGVFNSKNKNSNMNSHTRKLSGDLNNFAMNSEPNENTNSISNNINNFNNNNNNLSSSGNSFMNNNINNMNASASEKFYARRNYKEKLIELYTLSEKVIMFIELMQKLQEEISLKSGYVKELKVLFEETKLELIKIANESYNRAKNDLERELNSNCSLSNALDFSPGKMIVNSGKNPNKSSSKNLVNVNSKSKMNVKAGNKRNYNSTILNYVNKKFDSNNLSSSYNQNELTNISNNNTNNFNSSNNYNNFTSNNFNSTNFNAVNTEDTSNLVNSSFIHNNQNINKSSAKNRNNNKKKNFINENLRNLTQNNLNHQNVSKLMQESLLAHAQLNNEDEAENEEELQNNIQRENYEIYADENQNQIEKLNIELEENIKNLTAENNYLKDLNENLIKELNELRELGQNIENENQEKTNLIEELNEKITLMNQKLIDSVGEFENQQSENLNKIQEQESKINELLNELNITKLTNQALYAEINRRVNNDKSINNEQEENEEELVEGINNNNNNNDDENENYDEDEKENENSKNNYSNNNKTNEKFVFNSLNNKDEDEKYILNMEIEKQISENIQSKQLIEYLSNELTGLKSKYDSISKENKQIQEGNKILKNELEKLNRELASKETNAAGNLNQKIKEIEIFEKTIQDLKSIEKTDKAEIKKLNAKLNELDKQLSNYKNSLNESQIKLKVLKNEKDSLTDSLEKLKAEKTQNETKIREMQTKLDLFENQKNTLDIRYINLENDYNALLNEAEKLRKEIDANSKANGDLVRKSENFLLEKSALEASNKKLIKEIAELKNQFSFEKEKEKDEKNKNLISKIEDLESELSKLNANLNSKETEIKLSNKKNDELRSEIKSLSKASDNQTLELSNSRKIEDNLKTEIKNLLKSEENKKAEFKSLNKKEENLNEEIKKIKSELDLFKENNKKLNSDLVEKSSKIDIQRKEIELLLSSKDELNAKVKSVIDNEGLLKLEIEKLLKLEEKLRHEVKDHVEKEHSLREQNKILLQAEEKLKADINSLIKENENYKEIYNSNAKNEEEKVTALKNKMSELESENKKLKEKEEIKKAEIENIIRLNENFKKEKEELEFKLKEAEKAYKALNQEKDNFRAEAENLKVLTEDYDSKCERISELENKYRKLKQEKNNLNNEEIEKLNKLINKNAQTIKILQDENAKLLEENTELSSEIISNKNQSQNTNEINTEKDKKYGELETEKDQLFEKLKQVSQELETERDNKTKLKSLNETQLNYLLKFSDKFLEINNNALDSIENLNSKFTQADYVYQIPILDILHEINFSELKETFQRIRSNNIAESYNAIINFFSTFFEAKVLKIPETINQNIINIETKLAKVYEDWQAKLPFYSKIEKDLKNVNEKIKNSEIEKVNLATLLDGKEQECDQLTYKLADVEKKYKNFRESQKNNSQIHETKIENLDKENKKLLEALSNLQAELELVLDENEKLKNEKDQLGNLENIGFGNFMNSNNLLDNLKHENTISNRDVGNGNENDNHNNNLIIVNNDFDNDFNRDSFSHRRSNPIVPQETAIDPNCTNHAGPIVRQKIIKTLSLTDENITCEAPKNPVKSKYKNSFNFQNNNNNINNHANPIINNNDIYFNNEFYNSGENIHNPNSNNHNNNNYNKENELQQKLIHLEKKYNELFEDDKKLKLTFDECTQTIYDAIKHYSPNLFEDENNEACEASEKLGGNQANQNMLTIKNIPDSRGSLNSNYSFSTDRDLISKAVEMFKRYNKEINEKIKKLEEKNNELDMNSRTYKIMADEYKNAWELALKKSDKIQFDSLAVQHPPDIGELSERLKTDLANFTVEDLIEAGHILLDENGNISARNNLDPVNNNHGKDNNNQNLIKKLSGINLDLLGDFETAIPASRINNNNNRGERENSEFKSFNLGGNLLELNIDSFAEGEENNEKSKTKAAEEEEETKKFNYASYLEKFNNPAEYKILAFKKLSNDLVWYLLIPKNASNLGGNDNNNSNNKKANFENKFESNFAKNTSNISDLDFMMINKIRKKSSNKLNNFSSIEKDSGRKNNNSNNNGFNVLVKNYDYYTWVPAKIIANNLTNFEFEKNFAEGPNEVAAPNKERIVTQTSICEKCEMKQKELNVNFEHLNELEKKYTSMLDEKDNEIKELEKIQENLMQKLSAKEDEIIKFSSQNNSEFNNNNNNSNSSGKTVSLEKYETLLNEFREEQDKGYELMKVYEELKRDYDNLTKKLFTLQNENNIKVIKSAKSPNINKVPYALDTENMQKDAMDKSFNNKTTNEIKDLNDVEVGDLLEMHNRNSLGGVSDLKELAMKINNINNNFNTVPTDANNKSALNAMHNNMNLNTDGNDFTLNMNKTEGYYTHDNIKEAVSDYEKNEQLLMDQLMEIKDELKQTRNERDLIKKKYNDSITLQDGKKDEILNMLRSAVEKLIIEIQLTPKIKELLTVILKICDFDDDHIALIFKDKEQKKKSFFGFMNKK